MGVVVCVYMCVCISSIITIENPVISIFFSVGLYLQNCSVCLMVYVGDGGLLGITFK